MTDAFRRRANSPAPKSFRAAGNVGVVLRSHDSWEQRAANLMALAGIDGGDPKDLGQIQREIARGLEVYAVLDGINR